jgi:hypothetical protein
VVVGAVAVTASELDDIAHRKPQKKDVRIRRTGGRSAKPKNRGV